MLMSVQLELFQHVQRLYYFYLLSMDALIDIGNYVATRHYFTPVSLIAFL